MSQKQALPFKPGDWVAEVGGYRPTFGIVHSCFQDHLGCCINLIVYHPDGARIGRESPHEGGPRSYEPACSADHYRRIKEPHFPLQLSITGDYAGQLEYL